MNGRALFSLAVGVLIFSGARAQAPDPNQPINDILNNVKKRGADARRDDQRRALLVLQRAQHAHQAGRLAESLELARRAQQLFPESADIKRAFAGYQTEVKQTRALVENLQAAQAALEEAVNYAASLLKEERFGEAKELLESVRHLSEEFPAGSDLTATRAGADRLLAEMNALPAAHAELVPVPPRVLADGLTPSEMRLLLARRITVEWRDQPLGAAFDVIRDETGLLIKIDPYLERLGVFDVERSDLRISNAPVERMLRMVTDMSGVSYILNDGEIYVTTKANALALSVARPAGRVDLLPPVEDQPRRRVPPPGILPAPPPAKSAAYLISGQALGEHVRELLK